LALVSATAGGCRAPSAKAGGENHARAASPSPSPADESSSGESSSEEATEDHASEDSEPDLLPEGASPEGGADDGMAPASRYAKLDRVSCEGELSRRQIAWVRVDEARGVVAPVRLAGPLSGVKFRSNLPESKARTSPYDIYDCRLVLALDDFARILAQHEIVEVVHLSVYRPVSPKVALKGAGRRHSGALAIDAAIFKTKDGRALSVEKDFHGRIGARPCPAPESASELRKIACAANQARLFNVLLTPDFNWPHRNHFHLEVTANVSWTLVR
jgi:hypothetical protein